MEKETETVLTNKVKIAVICGPTATGKTKLAVEIAKKLNGEIICADSMQIYKGLDIGTAKATEQEMCEIPHHIVDFLSPEVVFSVADFVKLAHQFIKEISDKGKLPIIVGGTGLYISSLVNGITFTEEDTDLTVRIKLMEELAIVGGNEMYSRLCKIDPLYAQK
ncbi:MAG: tRNA (adenosine(37)-N6)-dimethylallyltransferase MiaA, partial [Oscillospiraceae bacterium]